jgi:uncharacterized protein (TIGR02596 family)
MKTPVSRCDSRQAFSLIELIVVMSIIGILATLAAPAAMTMIRGSAVTQASQMLTDQMSYARQLALSKNESVEVRFLQYGDPEIPGEKASDPTTGKFRAIQIMEVTPAGIAIPAGKLVTLPGSIMFNTDGQYSSILTGGTGATINPTQASGTDPNLPRNILQQYKYVSFRFYSDGSTSLGQPNSTSLGILQTDSAPSTWFLTIHSINDLNKITSASSFKNVNFFTLQIDPISGTTNGYRPTAL